MATKTIDNSWQSRLMKDVQAQLSDLQDKLPHKIQEIVKARLEKWKEVEINFAIIGNTGVGKSSFINAIRGYVIH
jgi:predicted GTPase